MICWYKLFKNIDWLFIVRYVFPLLFLTIIVIINSILRNYRLMTVNSDHILISRLGMSEKPIYISDIQFIKLSERKNGKAKLIIRTNKKQLNFYLIEPYLYFKLVDLAKTNKISFFLKSYSDKEEKIN